MYCYLNMLSSLTIKVINFTFIKVKKNWEKWNQKYFSSFQAISNLSSLPYFLKQCLNTIILIIVLYKTIIGNSQVTACIIALMILLVANQAIQGSQWWGNIDKTMYYLHILLLTFAAEHLYQELCRVVMPNSLNS